MTLPRDRAMRADVRKWTPAVKKTSTAKAIANPRTRRDSQLASHGKRTQENAALILGLLETGVPEGLAAARAGISLDTLTA